MYSQYDLIRHQNAIYETEYQMINWHDFDYSILGHVNTYKRRGKAKRGYTYNDVTIMLDTETSKSGKNGLDAKGKIIPVYNYVVAFTVSIRMYDKNLVTLYGNKPTEAVETLTQIMQAMSGDYTIVYVHNLSYDWTFLRRYLINVYGSPDSQLNVKTHYPLYIKWDSGLILKDSLLLAQRSLEKWANDLNVDHKKAVGYWDYNKIRHQDHNFTTDELKYIECDTLAGVECIDTLKNMLGKKIHEMPYTATGILREEVFRAGKKHRGRELWEKIVPDFETYIILEYVFHGGYTHANRHLINVICGLNENAIINGLVQCYDFSSSYPFVMLIKKFPMERFTKLTDKTVSDVLSNADDYAYIFKFVAINIHLKDYQAPMPPLQYSKCVKIINGILDNGRVLCSDYVEIYLNEISLSLIEEYYTWDKAFCTQVHAAKKDYLPRWFRNIIYNLYKDKTQLKKSEPRLYNIQKGKLNSSFGMCVQKSIKDIITEDYETGKFDFANEDPNKLYEKYLDSKNHVLPYQWGVWVTDYAQQNLFTMGKMCDTWVYSDTDSVFGIGWHDNELSTYNQQCVDKLVEQGYPPIEFDNRSYALGVAELDKECIEFKTMGAKRYAYKDKEEKIHITVAGVPKDTGASCLKSLEDFTEGFTFKGDKTGKLTHFYLMDEERVNEYGDEYADSIDLCECDYLLSRSNLVALSDEYEELIQVYE